MPSRLIATQNGKNFFNVFIDGDLAHPVILSCTKGENTYVATDELSDRSHNFLLTKRTEGGEGATTIKGVLLADGAKLLAPPKRPKRRIEFFGDSITSGMGNESPDDSVDNRERDKNNFLSYDAITARNLAAELHVTSQSGIGIFVSWFDFIMPQFYDQLSAVGNNDTHWDFSQWTPDVVVINLFQNDKWLIDREKRIVPSPTEEQRVQGYIDFVKTIRQKYPKAYFVCALGSMDATQAGSLWPGYVTAQLLGAVAASGLLRLLFPGDVDLGGTLPAGSGMQSLVLEFVLTFVLMAVVLNVSTGAKEKGMTAGITIGEVQYFDVPASQAASFAVIDTIEGKDSELRRLFEVSSGAPNNAMNFFLVREIKGGGSGFTILGIAGGIPGIPFEQGTNASGVAVTTLDLAQDPKSVARTMAHEGGHWLGLWHTTEQNGEMHDPLSDTPECPPSRDTNADKILTSKECQGAGAEYLMFWEAGPTASTLSGNEGYVLQRNPVVSSQ